MSAPKNDAVQDSEGQHERIEKVEELRVVVRPEAVKKDLTIQLNRLEGRNQRNG